MKPRLGLPGASQLVLRPGVGVRETRVDNGTRLNYNVNMRLTPWSQTPGSVVISANAVHVASRRLISFFFRPHDTP
jgi:hypothetical protein